MKRWFSGIWRTVLYSGLAGFLVFALWGFYELYTGHVPGQKELLSFMSFSFLADALLAFFLPVVAMGIMLPFRDGGDSLDLDFLISLGLGGFAAICGVVFQLFLIEQWGFTLPIIIGFLVFMVTLYDMSMSTAAVLTGYCFTFIFIDGSLHGWMFPWALILALLTKWFGVPWYIKGFVSDGTSKRKGPKTAHI